MFKPMRKRVGHDWKVNHDWIKQEIMKVSDLTENDLARELVITEIKDHGGRTGTVFYSLSGTPPRGFCIASGKGYGNGALHFIGWGFRKKKTYRNTKVDNSLS